MTSDRPKEPKSKPRLALDAYVLAQDVKTGVYRVCDELFARLVCSGRFDPVFVSRDRDPATLVAHLAERGLPSPMYEHGRRPSDNADILLSPFGVAPMDWRVDEKVLKAHIVYDLIAIRHPEYFTEEASDEVRSIVASLTPETAIFAISEHTKKDLLDERPDLVADHITVAPLAAGDMFKPCDDAAERLRVRRSYGIPKGVPYLLSVATLEIRKNLDGVVHAFARYLEQHPESDLHLVLAGMSGWKLEKMDAALAANEDWRHRIITTGFVRDEDLSALYSDALCFVCLSRYEGFGLPPLEAMACGTPVICADNSSLPEVVGDAGIMLDANDTQGVADAVHRLITDPALQREYSQRGFRQSAQFSWDTSSRIVCEGLEQAWLRYRALPAHVRRQSALDAACSSPLETRAASVTGFSDGASGPDFAAHIAASEAGVAMAPALVKKNAWPAWSDRLKPSAASASVDSQARFEGGLRTHGHIKSGTALEPLVSFVTIVRNNAQTLGRTIESIQQQTYWNVEHIVLDGASTDGTLDVIRQHADRLDYFASEPDFGLYDALNKVIPLARGDLICVMNSDDWAEPRAAEIAVCRMREDIGSPALLLSAALVAAHGEIHHWPPAVVHPGCYFMCANDCHNAIFATRSAYERSGPYDTAFRIASDFKWIMSCLEAGAKFVYTRESTVNYSLGGVSSSDSFRHSEECLRIVQERFPYLTPVQVKGLYHCFFRLPGELRGEQGKPEKFGPFLRDLYVDHADKPEFLSAVAWAAVETLEHPTDLQAANNAGRGTSIKHALKQLAKAMLRRFPQIYGVASRGYQRIKG